MAIAIFLLCASWMFSMWSPLGSCENLGAASPRASEGAPLVGALVRQGLLAQQDVAPGPRGVVDEPNRLDANTSERAM